MSDAQGFWCVGWVASNFIAPSRAVIERIHYTAPGASFSTGSCNLKSTILSQRGGRVGKKGDGKRAEGTLTRVLWSYELAKFQVSFLGRFAMYR